MKRQRNQAKVATGVCPLLILLGLSLLAFAGDLGLNRRSVGALGRAPSGDQSPTGIQALAGPLVPPLGVQTAIYIKLDGIDGESTDKDHKGWSNALSFSQAQSLPLSRGGAGMATSRPLFENIVVTKNLDKASPKLAEAVCRGRVFPKAEIHLTRSSGAGSQTYYKYELKNVIVSSYQVSGASHAMPMEEIALNFEEIKVTYTEQDETGKPRGNVEYSWKVL